MKGRLVGGNGAMGKSVFWAVSVAVVASCLLGGSPTASASALPENLATKAKITATSEYSDGYRASNVADGQVPGPMTQDDAGKGIERVESRGGAVG